MRQLQGDLGQHAAKVRQHGGHEVQRRLDRHAQRDALDARFARAGQPGLGAVRLQHDRFGVAQKDNAFGRQRGTLAGAVEQGDAVVFFEFGDALGQAGLRQPQHPRRWPIATMRNNRDEVTQLLKGHGRPCTSSCFRR